MTSLTCLPDEYLNETQLNNLFREFRESTSIGQSEAAIFSSIVNNVRHVYMAALLRAKAAILARCSEHAAELAGLRREHAMEQESPPSYRSGNAETGAPSTAETPADSQGVGGAEQAPSGDQQQEEISPARTFPHYIGSYSSDHRRDTAAWSSYFSDKLWIQRLEFKVFKFEEPGTIRINVTNQPNPHRVMVNLVGWNSDGWQHQLTFYAYAQQRPGTQMIWVAFRADPDRCIFLKGGASDKLEGWERRLEFWVPK